MATLRRAELEVIANPIRLTSPLFLVGDSRPLFGDHARFVQ
jgi:hypothetical protein